MNSHTLQHYKNRISASRPTMYENRKKEKYLFSTCCDFFLRSKCIKAHTIFSNMEGMNKEFTPLQYPEYRISALRPTMYVFHIQELMQYKNHLLNQLQQEQHQLQWRFYRFIKKQPVSLQIYQRHKQQQHLCTQTI